MLPLSRLISLLLTLLLAPVTVSLTAQPAPNNPALQRLSRDALQSRIDSLTADIRLEEYMRAWYEKGLLGDLDSAARDDSERRLRQSERTLAVLYELYDEAVAALNTHEAGRRDE
jgi:hypothetical protein